MADGLHAIQLARAPACVKPALDFLRSTTKTSTPMDRTASNRLTMTDDGRALDDELGGESLLMTFSRYEVPGGHTWKGRPLPGRFTPMLELDSEVQRTCAMVGGGRPHIRAPA